MHNFRSRNTRGNDWETIDYFGDESLVEDPYPYFEELRAACPVLALPHLGVVAVTGYDEATQVYRDVDTFSSCNSVIGPFATFPRRRSRATSVGDIIDRYRDQLPMHEHMVTMDPPAHTRERALLMRLITPKRLKDNEAFMWRQADQQLDEFVADGRCEFIGAVRAALRDAGRCRSARGARGRPPTVPRGFGLSAAPGEVGAGAEHAERHRAQSARVARRLVRAVHRGPTASRRARTC